MDIPYERWHQAIKVRRSRRQYNGVPLEADTLHHLVEFIEEINSAIDGVRAALVVDNPVLAFKGIIGSYGKIKNPPAYAAFIGDTTDQNVQEKVGYLGQCLILEATAMGLGTCWIGGFFKPETVKAQTLVATHERVFAITPVGYTGQDYTLEEKTMRGLASGHKRKDLSALSRGLSRESWPSWAKSALEAARLAPSAVNRQPWRFDVQNSSIKVYLDSPNFSLGVSKRLDCGIAMLHIQVGALAEGVSGSWEYLPSPDVALFTI